MSESTPRDSRTQIEASEWLVTLSDPAVTARQREQFTAWLNADPQHRQIFEVQKSVWLAVADMHHLSPASSNTASQRSKPLRRSLRFAVGIAASIAVASGASFFVKAWWPGSSSVIATSTAEMRHVHLKDGTQVTLSAASRLDVDFKPSERHVTLEAGEAFFHVVPDRTRPFTVRAGNATIRVVGTQFDVHVTEDSVHVAVLEGRVEVMKASAGNKSLAVRAADHLLLPGTRATVDQGGQLASETRVKLEEIATWREGRLVYVDTRLRDVIADLNRYYHGHIELTSPATGELRLTAALRVEQIDRMLDIVQNALPVRVERTEDGRILLMDRDGPERLSP